MAPGTIKRITIVVAVIVCATLTWAVSRPWLENPLRFSDWTVVLWPALAVVLLGAVTGVAWAILTSKTDRLAAILGSWATFIIFWPPDVWYVSALPVFLLFWFESSRRVRDDMSDRRRVRINAALGHGVKLILLGAFLMVSVGFYLLPTSREADVSTVSRGIQGQLEDAYDSPIVREQLAQLPPGAQNQFKRDMAQQVDAFVRKWLGPISGYIPPFLAFALFLALWSMSFIFREAAIWTGTALWGALKATRFIRLEEEEGKLETVHL